MKKYKKTYAISTLAEKHTTFHLGKTKVHVSFTGGQVTKNGVNPATFTTADPIVQLAIENSKAFADGEVTLLAKYPVQGDVKIGMNPPESKKEEVPLPPEGGGLERETPEQEASDQIPEAAEGISPEDKPADAEQETKEGAEQETKEGAEPGGGESGLEVVEVSCRDVAKQYLQEHFGEKPAPLRRIADIQECAAKYGITFNFV